MDVSVVICTHNRSQLIRRALTHLFAQETGSLRTEIVVVDNNSTDDTAEVVNDLIRGAPMETVYRFEAAQGISYARNSGCAVARGAIVAFTDDDVRVAPDWVRQIAAAFAANRQVDCVGGKVLPEWPAEPPAWLTREHWAPLAILDYGESPVRLDHDDPRCLIGANLAFRRDVFHRVGGFSPAVQRVKDGIGSIEDHEFLIRFWSTGGQALYVPDVIVVAPVDPQRLEKRYHRRWHDGHGQFHAVMRSPGIERSSTGRLFDVPAHLYRQCAIDVAAWCGHALRGRTGDAFLNQKRLRFFWGFFRTRRREYIKRRLWRQDPAEAATPASVPHRRSSGVS